MRSSIFRISITLSVVLLPAIFQWAAKANPPLASSLTKTRPEFLQPDLPRTTPAAPNPTPSPSPSPNTFPNSIPSPPPAINLENTVPNNPLPLGGAGAEGFGSQPIVPSVNSLTGTNRSEFQAPDLNRPSPSPSSSPTPTPSSAPSPKP